MSNSSIWPIDWTILCAPTPGQSRPGSDDNEEESAFPKASDYWRLTISFLCITSATLIIEEGLPLCSNAVGLFSLSLSLSIYIYIKRILIKS